MPTYEYKCLKCNHIFEVFQKITDKTLRDCPRCLGHLQKVYYPAGVIFKGSGFYITDSRAEKEKKSSATQEAPKTVDTKDTSNGNGNK